MRTEVAPATVRLSDELGQLPPTQYVLGKEGDGYSEDRLLDDPGWTEENMRSYAAEQVAAECGLYMKEIDRLRADRDLEKKWRKDAEHDREELIVAAVQAERERWQDRVDRAPVAIMDTRTALSLCAPTEADFPALYALQGRRVALVDLGPSAGKPDTSAPVT